ARRTNPVGFQSLLWIANPCTHQRLILTWLESTQQRHHANHLLWQSLNCLVFADIPHQWPTVDSKTSLQRPLPSAHDCRLNRHQTQAAQVGSHASSERSG